MGKYNLFWDYIHDSKRALAKKRCKNRDCRRYSRKADEYCAECWRHYWRYEGAEK